jgi:hypothetical protein
MLGALRALPAMASHLVHGEIPPKAPEQMRLHDTTRSPAREGGWILLGERPNEEIALGLVGKFWRPIIEFAEVGREGFRDFATPGYAKTIYALSVRPLEARRTLLAGVMRTATTDEAARTWFRRYWALGVGCGAHVLVNGVLEITREMAEAAVSREPAPPTAQGPG